MSKTKETYSKKEEIDELFDEEVKKKSNKTAHALNISYLDRLIKDSDLTQKALAAMIPCAPATIYAWLSGRQKITKEKLNALGAALNVDPYALLEPDDQRTLKYLRDLINKKIEHDRNQEDDLPLIDIPTLLQIAKILAYDKRTDMLVPVNPQEFQRNVPAEDQMNKLMGMMKKDAE